jgi:hypothetical protein
LRLTGTGTSHHGSTRFADFFDLSIDAGAGVVGGTIFFPPAVVDYFYNGNLCLNFMASNTPL